MKIVDWPLDWEADEKDAVEYEVSSLEALWEAIRQKYAGLGGYDLDRNVLEISANVGKGDELYFVLSWVEHQPEYYNVP